MEFLKFGYKQTLKEFQAFTNSFELATLQIKSEEEITFAEFQERRAYGIVGVKFKISDNEHCVRARVTDVNGKVLDVIEVHGYSEVKE